ncbi:hypothetical protein STENM223S_07584 [Streptomyces tendae]
MGLNGRMAHTRIYTLDPSLVPSEPRGGGLSLRAWDATSDADAQTWLRGYLDPDFQRWNTPLKPWTDLTGARESLRARARDAADGRSAWSGSRTRRAARPWAASASTRSACR